LEGEAFDEATYGELRRMAKTLGLDLNRLVETNPSLQSGFYLSRGESISFQVDGRSVGYKIISSVPPQPNLFVGKLLVLPKASLSAIQTPHAEIIFLQMILGSLAVTFKGESHEVREGRSLIFQGDQPYRIENPLVRESVGLLVTHPAFTQGQGVEKVERDG
jgi:mannose-6-phosphate isomerase-like protein (cupin superfamily)